MISNPYVSRAFQWHAMCFGMYHGDERGDMPRLTLSMRKRKEVWNE